MAKKSDIELARILTQASLIKLVIICSTIIIGTTIVCYTAFKMTEKPSWLVVVLALIAALSGPSTGIGIVIWLWKRYITKFHTDRVELERFVDPTRKSSES